MKIVDKFLKRMGYIPTKTAKRAFEAAKGRSILDDWLRSVKHIDEELKNDHQALVSRARQLVQNDEGGAGFLKTFRRNVFGPDGIALQMKVRDPQGTPDKYANDMIEVAWSDWGKKQNCSVTASMTWRQVQWLCSALLVSDGEVILRKHVGFDNPHRYAIQFIDTTLLPTNYNRERSVRENEIRMGVEYDVWGKKVAYHFIKAQNTWDYQGFPTGDYIRVPADEIVHVYPVYRIGQSRGWPLIVPAMMAMHMLGAYQESEVTAARAGAAQLGFIETPTGDEYAGEETSAGGKYADLEPGSITELSKGQKFNAWNPTHPTSQYPSFVKAVKQSISMGLGISYPTFSGDLEGVNFSSIRAGVLEEREEWKYLQSLIIDDLCTPIFEDWLKSVLTSRKVALPLSKYEKFNSPQWTGRRWTWVDPEKDIDTNIKAVENGFASRSEICRDLGKDYEDILQEQKQDEELEKKYGVTPVPKEQMNIEKEKAKKPEPVMGEGKPGGKNGNPEDKK